MANAKPWDFLNPNTEYVDESEFSRRMSICKSCPRFIKTTSQCKECGCFMNLKAKISHAYCPLAMWEL